MKVFRAKYPSILRLLYPGRLSVIKKQKAIYLTFDDGPVPEVTPWVLQELKKFDAKATFFCIGENVQKHPEIFQQLLKDNHCIGNHTYNHLDGWKTSTSEYLENTEKTNEILESESIPQAQLKLFRPPYGKIKNTQARKLTKSGYQIVMWDVISGDYDSDFSAEKCFHNVIDNSTEGSTIVFHDSQKAFQNLKVVLPKVLEHFQNKGWEFRSLKDAL